MGLQDPFDFRNREFLAVSFLADFSFAIKSATSLDSPLPIFLANVTSCVLSVSIVALVEVSSFSCCVKCSVCSSIVW